MVGWIWFELVKRELCGRKTEIEDQRLFYIDPARRTIGRTARSATGKRWDKASSSSWESLDDAAKPRSSR